MSDRLGDPLRIAIACEDEGHFYVVSTLIDSAAVAEHGWLDGVLDAVRVWQAEPGTAHPPYAKCSGEQARWREPSIQIPGGPRIRLQGHIDGEPLQPEANMWRHILAYFAGQEPRPAAVVLVRDLDGAEGRRRGMEQVCGKLPWPSDMPIILATPEPEIEAWLVSGFEPEGPEERDLWAGLCRQLSFDPTTASNRLTSHPNTAPTDAKRVLEVLTDRQREREDRCLSDPERLRIRGGENHCRAFLDEVDQKIVPLFGRR